LYVEHTLILQVTAPMLSRVTWALLKLFIHVRMQQNVRRTKDVVRRFMPSEKI